MYSNPNHDVLQRLRIMSTEMGDYLSRQYAGTDSTISGVSRDGKETAKGKIGHKTVAVKRFFLNTFNENPMQLSIDIVLGKWLNQGYATQQTQYIQKQMALSSDLKPTIENITIATATWNLGHVKQYESCDLK